MSKKVEVEEKKDDKCPSCVGRCDCSTISDCDKCGTPHCKNCQYED